MFYCLIALLFTILLTALSAVKIDKLILPDVIQSGAPEGLILDCLYTVNTTRFTLQWLFNNSHVPVYSWRPGTVPVVRGIMEGRLDLTYRASTSPADERRAVHIVTLEPDLSGQYTCQIVSDDGEVVQETRSMLVFSPERDFTLELQKESYGTRVQCFARGVFPKPELTLEQDGTPFSKQQQRVWRDDGPHFDTESTAFVPADEYTCRARHITCRLQLPQAGYTAMKKELILADDDRHCRTISSATLPSFSLSLTCLFYLM